MGLVIFSVILVIGLFGILGANFRRETWRIQPRQLLSVFGLLILLFGAFKTLMQQRLSLSHDLARFRRLLHFRIKSKEST
jgi:uncharacterized membrane protein